MPEEKELTPAELIEKEGWNKQTFDKLRAMGKNPRLYEPMKPSRSWGEYTPDTPEEKRAHEEFIKQSEALRKRFREKRQEK